MGDNRHSTAGPSGVFALSFSHIVPGQSPSNATDAARLARAKMIKGTVLKTAETVKGFNQKPGDGDEAEDKIDIKGQNAPTSTATKVLAFASMNPLMMMGVSGQLSGKETLDKDGEVKTLDATTTTMAGTEEIRYEKKDDGSKIYSASDMLGYLTIREQKDGTLFIAPGKDQFNNFASDDFQAPANPVVDPNAPKTEGVSSFIPASVGDINLSETASKAGDAINEGGKKLGAWLSDISDSVSESMNTAAKPQPEGAETAEQALPAPVAAEVVKKAPPTPVVSEPTEKAAESTESKPEFVPTHNKEELIDAAKNLDVGAIVGGGLNDLAKVGKGIFGGLFGKK